MANENISVRIQAIDSFSGTMRKFQSNFSNARAIVRDFGERAVGVGTMMSKLVTAPILGVGATAIAMGADFEKSMSHVQAVTQASSSEMDQMESVARKLGETTPKSAREAAEGMVYLGKAGFSTNEILEATPHVLDLAIAGELDLADAADIASNILEGFGMEAKESGRMADVLAKSASSANTDVGQMGYAMSYVAPVARGAGISLEETSAAIGMLSDAGIQGERAGTSLRNIIASLQNPTGAAQDALEDLGLSMEEVDPTTHSLAEVFNKLRDAGVGSSEAMLIAGDRGGPALAALLSQGEDKLEDFTRELENSEGTAHRMSEVMQDNLQGSIKELTSAAQEVALQFYDNVKPALRDAVDWLTDLVRSFGRMDDSTQKFIIAIGGAVAAIGPLIAIFGGLAFALQALASPAGLAVAALAALTAGGIALAKKLNDPIVKTEEFGGGISDASRQAIEAYGKLRDDARVKLEELATSQEGVTKKMADDLVKTYKEMGNAVIEQIEDNHSKQLETLSNMFSEQTSLTKEEQKEIIEAESDMYKTRKENVNDNVNEIEEIVQKAAEEEREITSEEKQKILENMTDMNEDMVDVTAESTREQKILREKMKTDSETLSAEQAAEVAKNANDQRDKAVKAANEEYEDREKLAWDLYMAEDGISADKRDAIIEDAKKQRKDSVDEANSQRDDTIDAAKEQSEEVIDYVDWQNGEVKSGFAKLGVLLKEQWDEIAENSKKSWENLADPAKDFFSDIGDWFKELPDKISHFLNNASWDIKNWFAGQGEEIRTNAKETWKNLTEPMKEKFDQAKEWAGNLPSNIGNAISDKAGEVWDGVKSLGRNIIDTFANILGIASPSKVFIEFGGNIIDGLIEGLGIGPIKDFFTKLPGRMKSWFSDNLDSLKNFFSSLPGKISGWLKEKSDDIKSGVQTVVDKANEKWEGAKSGAKKAWGDARDAIGNATDTARKKVHDGWDSVKKKTSTTLNSAKDTASNAWNKAKDGISNATTTAKNKVSNGWDNVKSKTSSSFNSAKNTAVKTWNKTKDGVSKSTSDTESAVSRGWNSLKAKTTNLYNKARSAASDNFSRLKTNVSGSANTTESKASTAWGTLNKNTVSMMKEVKNSATTRFKEIVTAAKGLPGQIGSGLKNAAKNAVSGVKSLATTIIDRFKSALGIHSPSTVFEGFGQYIIQGLNNGLSLGNIKDLGTSLIEKATGGLFKGFKSIKKFVGGSMSTLKNMMSLGDLDMGGVSGDLSGWIAKALAATGAPASWAGPIATIAKHESGGKTGPSTINTWDSNFARGTPSMGVMQTIGPTFEAHKVPGLGGIMDPVANIAAAINYIKSRYGNPMNTPGLRSMANGGPYKGYAHGGKISKDQWAWVGENGPELMHLNAGSRVYSSSDSRGLTKQRSGDSSASGDVTILKQIRDELREQREMIIELDGRTVGKAVEPYVSRSKKRSDYTEAKSWRGRRA